MTFSHEEELEMRLEAQANKAQTERDEVLLTFFGDNIEDILQDYFETTGRDLRQHEAEQAKDNDELWDFYVEHWSDIALEPSDDFGMSPWATR